MLKTLLITNDPAVAGFAVTHGVGRIMVDTEITGKAERQAGKDMVLSDHRIADVGVIRAALPAADLMLRINPFHPGTGDEIRQGAALGANLVMLPMVAQPAEVAAAGRICEACGIGLVPLVETPAAIRPGGARPSRPMRATRGCTRTPRPPLVRSPPSTA
jgi:citrate lyase beta subunit